MNAGIAKEIPSEWIEPPSEVTLPAGEIHIWHTLLHTSSSDMKKLLGVLSADEIEKSEKYIHREDRNHFIIARGVLRSILGRYLSLHPSEIQFSYSEFGRPELNCGGGPPQLRFNVSHSGDRALIALVHNKQVGVDIEQWREGVLEENVAERFFSDQEVAALHTLPKEKQVEGFFACWSRKEAYIKALGEGLSVPLDAFTVTLVPGEPAALIQTSIDFQTPMSWSLVNLPVGHGYSAAFAVHGDPLQVRLWRWSF